MPEGGVREGAGSPRQGDRARRTENTAFSESEGLDAGEFPAGEKAV